MSLDQEQVKHVAKLSAIALSDKEVPALQKELSEVLSYMECLNEATTEDTPATSHVHGVVNAFREDATRKSLSTEDIAKIAPDFLGNQFRVPKVI